jgi:carboxyl-terminal processing protease
VTRAAAAVLGLLAASASLRAQTPAAVETFDVAWTVIRDSHFDPGMNGVDWNAVRAELRPRAEAAGTPGELRAVLRDMLGRLGQSHFALLPAGADAATAGRTDLSGQPGFDTRLVEGQLVVSRIARDGAAAEAGVRQGWIVESIGTTAAGAILASVDSGLPPRLYTVEAWKAVQGLVRGPDGSRVPFVFRDGAGRRVPLELERRPEAGAPVKVGNLPTMFVRLESEAIRTPRGANAGVIRFNVWMAAVDAAFQKAVDGLRSADGIVLDLRGNPGGLAAMLMGISGHFLTERVALGVMKTRENELRFTANPRLVSAAGDRVHPFAGPLAILVDGLTGSASECFAGGMQSIGRARIFGETTMGQALPAVFRKLPNGDVLIHAYGDFVTATGVRLEGQGVIPDEQAPLSRENLLAGRDAALERALQWIDRAVQKRKDSR